MLRKKQTQVLLLARFQLISRERDGGTKALKFRVKDSMIGEVWPKSQGREESYFMSNFLPVLPNAVPRIPPVLVKGFAVVLL